MKISVVTVVKDDIENIEATICSVLSQTWKPLEYLILDGGSQDGTKELIEKHSDSLHYFSSEKDLGVYHAMNSSLSHINGEFVCFMNSGDEFSDSGVVADVVERLNEKVDLLYGDTIVVDGETEFYKKPALKSRIYREMPICHQSLFVRSSYLKANPFNLSYKVLADYNFILKAFEENKNFHYICRPISRYRLGGMSAKNLFQMDIEGVSILNQRLPKEDCTVFSSPHFKRLENHFFESYVKNGNRFKIKRLVKATLKLLIRLGRARLKFRARELFFNIPKINQSFDVAHFSTYVNSGGAGRAANRIFDAMKQHTGIESVLFTADKGKLRPGVLRINKPFIYRKIDSFLNGLRLKRYGLTELRADAPVSVGSLSTVNWTKNFLDRVKVFHFHWVMQDFVPLSSISKALKEGKKVVISLHDMWFVTGLCHNPIDCDRYKVGCGSCPLLGEEEYDLSRKLAQKKKAILDDPSVVLVAPSEWMKKVAEESYISSSTKIEVIANPIDTKQFFRLPDWQIKEEFGFYDQEKTYLLFGAHTNALYKGSQYVLDALLQLSGSDELEHLEIVIFGNYEDKCLEELERFFLVHKLGFVSRIDRLVALYSMADIFISASLQESFGQVLTEAMSCETACIAFRSSGALDIVDHGVNGYLAEYLSVSAIADCIKQLVISDELGNMQVNARSKCVENFDSKVIAQKYSNLYGDL